MALYKKQVEALDALLEKNGIKEEFWNRSQDYLMVDTKAEVIELCDPVSFNYIIISSFRWSSELFETLNNSHIELQFICKENDWRF